MPRYIDAIRLLRDTIYNPRHVPYIAESDILFAPTADVRENVHAHWVYKPLERSPEVTFPVCSNCDEDAIDYVESNFCPKCGAVMDEPTMEDYMYGQEGSEEDGV